MALSHVDDHLLLGLALALLVVGKSEEAWEVQNDHFHLEPEPVLLIVDE